MSNKDINMEARLLNMLMDNNGDWDGTYEDVSKHKEVPDKLVHDLPNKTNYIFILDQEKYPDKFKQISMPPFFIFWNGNVKLIDTKVLVFNYLLSVTNFSYLLTEDRFKQYTLCFNEQYIMPSQIAQFVRVGYNIIIVSSNGHLNYYGVGDHVLYISEYFDPSKLKRSPKQTSERIMYALANELYLAESSSGEMLQKILYNYDTEPKTIYCEHKLKRLIKNVKQNFTTINYVDDVSEIKV